MQRTLVFTDWLLEVLKLHFYWVVYLFRGWIVLGIFPATAAMYAVIRHWRMKEEELSPMDVLYKKYYEENYRVANILGWMFFMVTCVIAANFYFLPQYPETMRLVLYPVIIFFAFILLIGWMYMFPAIVHFAIPVASYFAVILKLGFTSFAGIIMQAFFLGIYLTVIYMLPALLILFGIVPLVFVQIAITFNIFQKVA